MIPASQNLSSAPLPSNLKGLLPHPSIPWNVSSPLFNRIKSVTSDDTAFKSVEVLKTDPEFNFILKYFEHQKPSGFSIKRIVCIHNPDQTSFFEAGIKNMERECSNPVFAPKGKNEEPQADRARVITRWEAQVAQFSPVEIKSWASRQPDIYSKTKVLPLWHGSTAFVCQSVCSSGFTFFGKHHYFDEDASKGGNKSTDKGYFGSGIYFTNSARYAAMYSSEGYLLLTWVSMREPYPVVNDKPHPQKGSDMRKLEGKEHYQNYNAHFIPVASIRPQDPKCLEYYPCYKDQPPAWDEFVVFYPNQALARFWIELGVDFPQVVISDLATNSELLNLLIHLLDQPEVKNHSALAQLLQSKVDKTLQSPETAPLNVEDIQFFKLAKRLKPDGEKLSPIVASMLLKSMSSSASPQRSLPPVPSKSSAKAPFPKIQTPLSVSLGEDEYQKVLSFGKKGDLKQAFISY
jgi:hypothetical protein